MPPCNYHTGNADRFAANIGEPIPLPLKPSMVAENGAPFGWINTRTLSLRTRKFPVQSPLTKMVSPGLRVVKRGPQRIERIHGTIDINTPPLQGRKR